MLLLMGVLFLSIMVSVFIGAQAICNAQSVGDAKSGIQKNINILGIHLGDSLDEVRNTVGV